MIEQESVRRPIGANLGETIICSPNKAIIRYKGHAINIIQVSCKDGCADTEVQFFFNSGRTLSWKTQSIEIAACMMWGIPLSRDDRFIYVPQEKGRLFCLSVDNGVLMWRTKSKEHFKNILVNPNGTLCCACGTGRIVVIDAVTGDELCTRKATNNQFTVLSNETILVEFASRWEIWDSTTLVTIESFSKKEMNSVHGRKIWVQIFKNWDSSGEYCKRKT